MILNEHTKNTLHPDESSLIGLTIKPLGVKLPFDMNPRIKLDLIGKKFGRLSVLSFDKVENKNTFFNCICDCGNICRIHRRDLTTGNSKSCGCLQKENRIKHGYSGSRLNGIWKGIRRRCGLMGVTPNNHKNYKDRGITMCDEWIDFLAFKDWALSNGYNESLSIDRIDNNGNYEPTNCRWATMEQQMNNKRNNKFIEYNGDILTISRMARKYNINSAVFRGRIRKGWDIERALFTPIKK